MNTTYDATYDGVPLILNGQAPGFPWERLVRSNYAKCHTEHKGYQTTRLWAFMLLQINSKSTVKAVPSNTLILCFSMFCRLFTPSSLFRDTTFDVKWKIPLDKQKNCLEILNSNPIVPSFLCFFFSFWTLNTVDVVVFSSFIGDDKKNIHLWKKWSYLRIYWGWSIVIKILQEHVFEINIDNNTLFSSWKLTLDLVSFQLLLIV